MARIKRSDKESSKRDTCFVITPFDGWFNDYYDKIHKPAIKAAGLDPYRADDLYRSSPIIDDIWRFIKAAKIVLADLSYRNPNVFYELGLAHAIATPAILISESMDFVPFDLRPLRVLIYDKNKSDWGEELKQRITKAILEIIKTPLNAVLPTFLKATAAAKSKPISESDKNIIELKQDVESLKREVFSYKTPHTLWSPIPPQAVYTAGLGSFSDPSIGSFITSRYPDIEPGSLGSFFLTRQIEKTEKDQAEKNKNLKIESEKK